MCAKLGPCIRPKENCQERTCFYYDRDNERFSRGPDKLTAMAGVVVSRVARAISDRGIPGRKLK